ncbi:MAG: hydrogenase maturation protease [Slackia sp.]|nr:hydrogenase maturation protease [Slackia sp.]
MENIAVICVGNRLMLDDGIGPAVFDELSEKYSFPEQVSLIDAGCMTMDLLPVVRDCDFLIVVDAIDGTGEAPGTVFRFAPEEIADHPVMQSLHDLRVIDLLNAAALLGYEAKGICFGIQVENMSPAFVTEGLTPRVHDALALAVDAVLAELVARGVSFDYADGRPFVAPAASTSLASVSRCAGRPSPEMGMCARETNCDDADRTE